MTNMKNNAMITRNLFTAKRLSIMLCMMLSGSILVGQGEKTMSLQACIDFALENQEQLKNKGIDEQLAEKDIKATIATGLPQISGSAQVMRNITFQNFFSPNDDPTAPNHNPTAGDVVPIAFATPYSGDLKITASQLLFSATYLVGLKAARTYKELTQKQTQQTKIDVITNVTKAYYGTVINEHRLELMSTIIEQLDTLLHQTEASYKIGLAEELDYERVKVNYNNNVTDKKNLERLIAFNHAQLKFQMGMDMNEKLSLSDKIDESFLADLKVINDETDFTNRIEYRLLSTGIALQELDVKNYKSQYLPSLSLFGNLGWNTGALNTKGIFSKDDGVGWLRYSFVGLNMSIPIFDGFTKHTNIQKAKLEIRKLENQKAQLLQQMNLELEQANIAYYSGVDRFEIQKDNMSLAKDLYESAIDKQKIGVGTTQEVLEVRTIYKEAETNYYAALYDLLIAKVDKEKALGLIVK